MGDIKTMFDPKSIALIGASDKERSAGRIILENLLLSKERNIFPVNPQGKRIFNVVDCYPSISQVPGPVDLAIIATPAQAVPSLMEECGKAGVQGLIIVSAGFKETGTEGEELEGRVAELQKHYKMRLLGPNCLGFIRPHLDLNTTPVEANPVRGNIAFISQSGAFGRALLHWGINAHMGFSMFVSLGSMIDVDFGEMIDFLGYDRYTRSIMIYMEESIGDVKKFMSAARGFARNKPIVVLRPPRLTGGRTPARTHTGQMAVSDRVYDAVLKRVGVVRVKATADLFNTAGVLYSKRLPKGPRLVIITNAAGVGTMATHTLLELGGRLARLSAENLAALRSIMPPYWKEGNPVDVLRDADVKRYTEAIKICLDDPDVDGILVIFTPQDATQPDELACAVANIANDAWKPIITSWMGGRDVEDGREIFLENNIPIYETPEEAVKTYLYMYSYERNLELLYETPADLPVDQAPPKNSLKALIKKVAATDRLLLTEEEAERFLSNYGIPISRGYLVQHVEQAVNTAKMIGYPLVLKIASPDITYKSDVGGVVTGINLEEELREEYEKLIKRVGQNCPGARIAGVTIQKMMEKIDYEIILGAKKDEDFGSVILFGMGGMDVEIFSDFSIGLPPLNQTLSRRLMEETRVYRLLQGHRGKPSADLKQLEQIIVSFSNLIVDFPEILEVDINPIALCNGNACALDAKIVIDKNCLNQNAAYPHLVLTPYPTKYITHWKLADGTDVLLRPIRPEDEPLEHEMLMSLSEETLRERFFQVIKHISHEMHIRFCNIDYNREMAIVAEIRQGEKRRIIGIGRLIVEPDAKKGEFAVVVHDDFHGKGLGYKLVDMMIGIAQEKGLDECYAFVQSDNKKMISVCRKLGCGIEALPDSLSGVSLLLK